MKHCDELRRWLDEGMPPQGAERARKHAAGCPACARELAAAAALERALASPPPAPPSGGDAFVARVLERIEGTTPFPAPALPAEEQRPARLWWSLLAEPGFVAGAAALFAILAPAPFIRGDAERIISLGAWQVSQGIGSVVATVLGAVSRSLAPAPGLHPVASMTLLLAFSLPLLWAGFWGAGAVDRWLRKGPGRRP